MLWHSSSILCLVLFKIWVPDPNVRSGFEVFFSSQKLSLKRSLSFYLENAQVPLTPSVVTPVKPGQLFRQQWLSSWRAACTKYSHHHGSDRMFQMQWVTWHRKKNVFYVSNPLLSIKHWCHPRSCMEIQAIDPLELFQLNWINSWVTPEREGHVQQAPHEPCPSNPARLCQNFIHREFHLFVIPLAFAWSHSKQQHSK